MAPSQPLREGALSSAARGRPLKRCEMAPSQALRNGALSGAAKWRPLKPRRREINSSRHGGRRLQDGARKHPPSLSPFPPSLSVCLYLSVCLSVCLSVHLFISLSIDRSLVCNISILFLPSFSLSIDRLLVCNIPILFLPSFSLSAPAGRGPERHGGGRDCPAGRPAGAGGHGPEGPLGPGAQRERDR